MEKSNKDKPAPRIPLHIEVDFRKSYAREPDRGVLKNISMSGAFLHNPDESFVEGEKINLEFSIAGRQRNIQATVIWSNEFGCGICFRHVNNRDRQIIDDLMYYIESKRNTSKALLDTILDRTAA